jgi:hypothetical protein
MGAEGTLVGDGDGVGVLVGCAVADGVGVLLSVGCGFGSVACGAHITKSILAITVSNPVLIGNRTLSPPRRTR